MSNLRIEFVPIQKFALGWFGFDHLHVIYEPDEIPLVPNPQDDWYVIEGDSASGGQVAKLGVLGESGKLHLSTANLASGADLIAKIGTPQTRGSRILTPNTDNIGSWLAIGDYGKEIEANEFPYLAYGAPYTPFPTFNSSSSSPRCFGKSASTSTSTCPTASAFRQAPRHFSAPLTQTF